MPPESLKVKPFNLSLENRKGSRVYPTLHMGGYRLCRTFPRTWSRVSEVPGSDRGHFPKEGPGSQNSSLSDSRTWEKPGGALVS